MLIQVKRLCEAEKGLQVGTKVGRLSNNGKAEVSGGMMLLSTVQWKLSLVCVRERVHCVHILKRSFLSAFFFYMGGSSTSSLSTYRFRV